jgi:hypothetical protein
MSLPIPTEHQEQVALMQWAKLQHKAMPALELMFAVPNGGARNVVVAKKLKGEGVKAGVPDLFLPVARKPYHGLFIEMKRTDKRPTRDGVKGGVSDKQEWWISKLKEQGYKVEVCYGWKEAAEIIEDYLLNYLF